MYCESSSVFAYTTFPKLCNHCLVLVLLKKHHRIWQTEVSYYMLKSIIEFLLLDCYTLNIRNNEHPGDKLEVKDGIIHNG